MTAKARSRSVSLDDLQGGTFTVTNLGGLGGTSFTPIINHPEVAILGMGRVQEKPVVRDGEIVAVDPESGTCGAAVASKFPAACSNACFVSRPIACGRHSTSA